MEDNQQEGNKNEIRVDEVNQNVNQQDEVNQDGLALENIDRKTLDLFFDTIFGKSAKLALLAKKINDLFYMDPPEDFETRTQRKLELCRRDQLLEFAKYMGKELPSSMTKAEIIQNLVELLKGRRRGLPEKRSLTAAKIQDATRKFFKIRMMGPMTDNVLARKQVLSQRGIKKIAIVLEEENINEETKNMIRMTWEAELKAFLDRREATAAPTDEEINSAIGKALRIMLKMGTYETFTHVQLQQQVAIILECEVEVIRRKVTMETAKPEYDRLEAEIQHDQENAENAVVNDAEHIDGLNAEEHNDGLNGEEHNDGLNAEEAEEEVEAEVAEHVAINEAGEQQEQDDNAVANN